MYCSSGGTTDGDGWELGQSEGMGDAGTEERLILPVSEELCILLGVRKCLRTVWSKDQPKLTAGCTLPLLTGL